MDIAAPAYHWSDLKITRLLRFFAARGRGAGFLPTGLVFVVFAISAPITISHYHSSGHAPVTVGPKKRPGPCRALLKAENDLKFNDFFAAPAAQSQTASQL